MSETVYADDIRPRHRWTVADYHKMGEVGLLNEDSPVELIDGDIVEMTPISSRRAGTIAHLNHLVVPILRNKAIVSVRNPVVLNDYSEPQPDVTILRWRDNFYSSAHPGPQDVPLLIEVADTTVRYDREVKVPLYARHGVPEVWLLDLDERRLEVYRYPREGEYGQVNVYREGRVSPESLPEVSIPLSDLFPNR